MADQHQNYQFPFATVSQDEANKMVDVVTTDEVVMDVDNTEHDMNKADKHTHTTDLSTQEDVTEREVPQVDTAVTCNDTVNSPVSAIDTNATSAVIQKPALNEHDLVIVPNNLHFTASSQSLSSVWSQAQRHLQHRGRQRMFAAKTVLMEYEENHTRRKRGKTWVLNEEDVLVWRVTHQSHNRPSLLVASKSVSPGGQLLDKVSQEDMFKSSSPKTKREDSTSRKDTYTRTSPKIKPSPPKKGPKASSLKKKGPKSSALKKGPKTKTKTNALITPKSGKEVYRGPPTEDIDGGWPPGWIRTEIQRQSGTYAGFTDRYWFSPGGKKFRSMIEIRKFFIALSQYGGDEEEAWKVFKSVRL